MKGTLPFIACIAALPVGTGAAGAVGIDLGDDNAPPCPLGGLEVGVAGAVAATGALAACPSLVCKASAQTWYSFK